MQSKFYYFNYRILLLMCYLCYMSINTKIRSEKEELFNKVTFCISSNYPTSDPLCGQTNSAIFIKKILHSNFILYYNISKAQLDSSMGRHLNPCLLFRTSTTTTTTSTTDDLGWNLSSRQMNFFAGNKKPGNWRTYAFWLRGWSFSSKHILCTILFCP